MVDINKGLYISMILIKFNILESFINYLYKKFPINLIFYDTIWSPKDDIILLCILRFMIKQVIIIL